MDEDKEEFLCPECNVDMNKDSSVHKHGCKNAEKAMDTLKWLFGDSIPFE